MRKATKVGGPVFPLTVMLFGVALAILYQVLKAKHVGKLGAPTDIGGAAIELAGYVLIFVGVILLWTWYRARRRS